MDRWLTYAISAIVTLLAGFFEYYRRKVDRIEECYVKLQDFKEYMREGREDQKYEHEQNSERLDRLGDDMNRLSDRIDRMLAK